jgi:hypothetical protein
MKARVRGALRGHAAIANGCSHGPSLLVAGRVAPSGGWGGLGRIVVVAEERGLAALVEHFAFDAAGVSEVASDLLDRVAHRRSSVADRRPQRTHDRYAHGQRQRPAVRPTPLAQRDPADRRRGFLLTAVAIFACWNAGTLAGALAGDVLGDPQAFGLDAIFPAVFLALLVPQVRSRAVLRAALAGAAIAALLLPVAPAGVPVMAAVLAATPLLVRRAPS